MATAAEGFYEYKKIKWKNMSYCLNVNFHLKQNSVIFLKHLNPNLKDKS
jgi:hypothetical protein